MIARIPRTIIAVHSARRRFVGVVSTDSRFMQHLQRNHLTPKAPSILTPSEISVQSHEFFGPVNASASTATAHYCDGRRRLQADVGQCFGDLAPRFIFDGVRRESEPICRPVSFSSSAAPLLSRYIRCAVRRRLLIRNVLWPAPVLSYRVARGWRRWDCHELAAVKAASGTARDPICESPRGPSPLPCRRR